MKILVTGGSGFIGAWIIRRLLTGGHDVRVFDINKDRSIVRSIAGKDAENIDWCAGDIRDGDSVIDAAQGCDTIIHLAAVLTPACQEQPRFGAEIIVIGTLNVFEAARQHQMSKIVYASSAGVFGPKDGRTPFSHHALWCVQACDRGMRPGLLPRSRNFQRWLPSLRCLWPRPRARPYCGPKPCLPCSGRGKTLHVLLHRSLRHAFCR